MMLAIHVVSSTSFVQAYVLFMRQEYQLSCRPMVVFTYFLEAFSCVYGLTSMMAVPDLFLVSYCLSIVLNM